ncbi:MAG: FG-GAP-like repeat-containing protein, partial [Gemmataceae bacterium]|nr:FG-GAP-like repeat-containing protein [Gemmataceae bacterium]
MKWPNRRGWLLLVTGLILVLGLGPSCQRGSESPEQAQELASAGDPPWFAEVATAWGVDFVHDPGPVGTYFMPQSMGSGLAVFDCDGDGLLDVYLLQFGGPQSRSVNRLFRQVEPGKFEDITVGSGLDVAGHCHGVAVGDVNN